MSELTKQVRADQLRIRSRVQSSIVSHEMFDPKVITLCDEHERLEAEHERVCNEHALLVQESGREGRELDRLEGLMRAWGNGGGDHRRVAVYAEAVRLAKESE